VEALDDRRTRQIHEMVGTRSRKIAILQTNIDVLADWSTDTGQSLIGKARSRVIDATGVERSRGVDRVLHAGHTDTAADKALQTIIGTEVKQAVDHEAEHAGAASSLVVA
jgi:hypothetical protein